MKYIVRVFYAVFITLFSILQPLCAQQPTISSNIPSDLPQQPAEYGKCFAKIRMPDKYEWVEQDVMISPQRIEIKEIPAVYDTIYEQVLVKEEHTEFQLIPAVYEITEEEFIVKEGSDLVSEKYKTVVQTQLVRPEQGQWVSKKDPNCFSKNSADCMIMYWEAVPAQYDTSVNKILTEMSSIETGRFAPLTKKIKKAILKQPATIKEIIVPAEYAQEKKIKLIQPARKEEITIPPKYKKIKQEKMIARGGQLEWVEVLCPSMLSPAIVKQIQQALNIKGEFLKIDGILGPRTKNALSLFQQKKHLPEGNLNAQTLRALGLAY